MLMDGLILFNFFLAYTLFCFFSFLFFSFLLDVFGCVSCICIGYPHLCVGFGLLLLVQV